MDSGKQRQAKAKGLRSKRRPRHPPFNAVESTVYNFFTPLELDIANAFLLLRGVASEPDSKSNMPKLPKMHECTVCGLMFSSGQALGGHKRAHYERVISQKRKRVESECDCSAEKKTKRKRVGSASLRID